MINPKKLTAMIILSMMMTGTAGSCGKKEDTKSYPEIAVTFLDVGKADSMVIRTENSTVIIDCGEKGDGKEIVGLLEDEGVTAVDYLIITHYDKDHVGGASKIIKSFDVKNVLAPDYAEESEEMEKYEKALEGKGITPVLLTDDLSFTLDDARFTVFAPEQSFYGDDNDNDFSLVTKLTYHDTSFLFTGDAMEQRLEEIMDVGRCTLLKIPYHGRKLDNLGEFLNNTQPMLAVVCTSDSEFSSKTQKLLDEKKIVTYSTCYNGTITAVSDGKNISVSCEKGSSS